MKVSLNGRLLPAAKAVISIFDHGFLYGDGVYETVLVEAGHPFRWKEHWARLERSARAIGLEPPVPASAAWAQLSRLWRSNGRGRVVFRFCLSRGPGALGLSPSSCVAATFAILPHPPRPIERLQAEGITLAVSSVQRMPAATLDPAIKAASALPFVQAKREADGWHAAEAVLLNAAGHLTEGSASNLFWWKGGVLRTPRTGSELLPGVTRSVVLELARKGRVPVREGDYRPADLTSAEEAFITSTGLGIVPAIRLRTRRGHQAVGSGRPGFVTRLLQAGLAGLIAREAEKGPLL